MPFRRKYVDHRFTPKSLDRIEKINAIIASYRRMGFSLTLRQVYYRLVATDVIANNDREYKSLSGLMERARMAGLMDMDGIEDRTRYVRENSHWTQPGNIVRSAADSFQFDKWFDQPYRPIVLVEKDALVDVIRQACEPLDVPYSSCRGYMSLSEIWRLSQRLLRYHQGTGGGRRQIPIIFHLGDHDPSGVHMTKDIGERLETLMGGVSVKRLALNMPQVQKYDPPPNPAKETDSRFAKYYEQHGDECWELDALEPDVIVELIQKAIKRVRDDKRWNAIVAQEKEAKRLLHEAADEWPRLAGFLAKKHDLYRDDIGTEYDPEDYEEEQESEYDEDDEMDTDNDGEDDEETEADDDYAQGDDDDEEDWG